jgi:hypothetical protein
LRGRIVNQLGFDPAGDLPSAPRIPGDIDPADDGGTDFTAVNPYRITRENEEEMVGQPSGENQGGGSGAPVTFVRSGGYDDGAGIVRDPITQDPGETDTNPLSGEEDRLPQNQQREEEQEGLTRLLNDARLRSVIQDRPEFRVDPTLNQDDEED